MLRRARSHATPISTEHDLLDSNYHAEPDEQITLINKTQKPFILLEDDSTPFPFNDEVRESIIHGEEYIEVQVKTELEPGTYHYRVVSLEPSKGDIKSITVP